MSQIISLITVGEKEVLVVDSDPSTGGGLSAPIASIAVYDSGSAGYAYLKVGSLDTDWQQLSTAAGSGFVNAGVAGRLSVYPATGNAVDDVYTQNSQSIDVAVEAQPTRSAGIEYLIPNPGDAVTAASFVLTEGAQTINGAKTLTSALAMSSQKITGLANGTTTNDAVNFGQLSLYIPLTQKGANSGVATLDAGGKIPVAQLPSAVMTYEGTFDASATPASPLLNGDPAADAGMVYLASVGGSYDFGAGAITFAVGDWAVYNGTIWQKSINSNAVVSVNGSTGVVTVNAINQLTGDVTTSAASGSQSLAATIAAGAVTASKLGTVTDGITLDQSGTGSTLEVKTGGISNAQINGSAAIAFSKMAALTASKLLVSDVSGVVSVSSGSGFVKATSGTPSYVSAIDLTTDVTGILPLANGGTNANLTAAAGGIVYSGASAMAITSAGTAGQPLLSGGASAPTWFTSSGVVKATSGVLSTSAVSLTSEVSGVLPVANGGTNSSTALNNNRIMVSSAGAIVEAAALTDGQLLIGSTGAAPVAASITGTSNQITVTPGAGSITLSTPQDIATTSTPTFAGLNIINSTANYLVAQANTTTTNATVTTIATIATSSGNSYHIKATIVGKRTGGSAGSTGDSCVYVRDVRVKNIAGTLTLANLQSSYTSEDQVAFNGTITSSGTNILVQVQGAANNNVSWSCTYEVISI